MIIKDIQDVHTGKTRTDGRYPLRIGSTVEFHFYPRVGMSMEWLYLLDNQGNPKNGLMRTSKVATIYENNSKIVVDTLNSRYIFSKE